jgi:hypothetical protein
VVVVAALVVVAPGTGAVVALVSLVELVGEGVTLALVDQVAVDGECGDERPRSGR